MLSPLSDEETVKTAVISPEVHTEWITFHALLAKKPEDIIALQLKELITNEMLVTMFQFQQLLLREVVQNLSIISL